MAAKARDENEKVSVHLAAFEAELAKRGAVMGLGFFHKPLLRCPAIIAQKNSADQELLQ
ncbi:MAG: hypothetical protein ACLPSF_06505 [Methylocella sp.]